MRDRFVDAVRAAGTVTVVGVHWLMAEAVWDGTTLEVGNALRHGYAWTLTWPLQVLALLFFAAGASAAYQVRAGHRPVTRVLRGLAPPVAVFVAVWALAPVVLPVLGVPEAAVLRAARIAPQPLWFLAVYLPLVATVPLLARAVRARPVAVVAGALAVPAAVEVLRFGAGVPLVGWFNLGAVWLVPFLLGVVYVERPPARRLLVPALVLAVTALVALVTFGPYPASMIGMPGDRMSNLGPPTAPVLALAVAQVCAVLLLRQRILVWVARPGVRSAVAWLSVRSMTLYLWHLTAMFAVVGVVLIGFGAPLPEAWSVDWVLSRPGWYAAFAGALGVLVMAFGRVERGRAVVVPVAVPVVAARPAADVAA